NYLIVYPNTQDKRLDVKVCDSKDRFIDLTAASKSSDFPEKSVLKVVVEKFPESIPDVVIGPALKTGLLPAVKDSAANKKFFGGSRGAIFQKRPPCRRRQDSSQKKPWVFENRFSLQGGLSQTGKKSLNLSGELIVNAKSKKGLLIQAAGKIDHNDYIKRYGFSAGAGFEPKNLGFFLFVDSLYYKYNDFDGTYHVQVRPAVRLRLNRLAATLFYAVGFGDQYTGVNALELSPGGETIGIYNKALSHIGIDVKTFLFNKLYLNFKGAAAAGKVYKLDCEAGFELLKNLYVTGNYSTANFGKYPEPAKNGFSKQNTFGVGFRYLFGNNNKPHYDLRTRNIVEPAYPIIVSYKKVIKKEKEEKKENDEEEQPESLKVNLSGNPLSGKAPLPVNFEAEAQGGQSPYKYKWYFEGSNSDPVTGQDKESHTYYEAGSFEVSVKVEDSKGNKTTSNTLKIEVSDSGKYKIEAIAHEGAKIKPAGTILAEAGGNYKFEMSALEGYKIDRVEIDGKDRGALSKFTFKEVDEDHKIEVWAKKDDGAKQLTITSISNTGGHNDPEGTILVDEGDSLTVNISPDPGYKIQNVKVDGKNIGAVTEYKFEKIKADHTIESFFEVSQFTIEAIQNPGGTISPPGITTVEKGGGQEYVITVDTGKELTDLLVDGVPVGAPANNTYTFSNVQADHTIEPLFGQQTLTITATSEGGGSIIESGTIQVVYGSDKTFRFSANEGWEATELRVDGAVLPVPENNRYTFTNVTESHTIHIKFTKIKYTITVIYNDSGTVTPSTCEVEYSQDKTFQIVPEESHNIADVKVDGVSQGEQESWTLTDITADHTIEVFSEWLTFEISETHDSGGRVYINDQLNPGKVTVKWGENVTLRFDADGDSGKEIKDITIDGQSKGVISTYTFEAVKENHSVNLSTQLKTFVISESHGTGGVVTINGSANPGSVSVDWGQTVTCSFSADSSIGYEIKNARIDGTGRGSITTWTFPAVKENHSINLLTRLMTFTISETHENGGQVVVNGAMNPGSFEIKWGQTATIQFDVNSGSGKEIENVIIDGISKGPIKSYPIPNVAQDHSIHLTVKYIYHTIQVSYGPNGSITPGIIQVKHGDSQTIMDP
ncbi:MAG: PKD domain-containing protein, partial [Candidatus Aminicenantes bacterium]|nr:PKD domain-containing protein [Candidatus Aminicenantes bacterium]